MKSTWFAVMLSLVAALAASIAVHACWRSDEGRADAADPALERKLANLQAQLAELSQRIAKVETAPNATGPARIDQGAVDQAARKMIEDRAKELAADGHASGAHGDRAVGDDVDVAKVLQQIAAPGTTREQKMALWKRLAAAGKLDQAIAALEDQAGNDPNNAGLRIDIGNAYLQKVFNASDDQKGPFAYKSDAAFDAALKIDPDNWEARFTKAVSLSYWPPIAGKMPEAISQFETLVSQQEQRGDAQPQYARTYLLLGNLYRQNGQIDKAKDVWAKGAARFPNDEQLRNAGG
jgi:tetratricopeptide (TPR) repeat protein